MHVNVLDFIFASSACRLGAERFSRTTAEGTDRRVRLSGISFILAVAGVKPNYSGRKRGIPCLTVL